METWILQFSPKLSTSLQALHLHGAAAVHEDENSILQRKLLEQSVDVRQRTRGLDEVFCEILEKAIMQVQITFKKAPDFVISNESFNFMRSNIECFEETPLYYNPPAILQFQDLAVEIHTKSQANIEVDSLISEASSSSIASTTHIWDWSVSNLICSLDNIHSNENWKEMIRHRVSCLRLLAAIPPHPTALLYTAMYKALTKIASDVEEVMEERDNQNKSETSSTFEMESDSKLESGFVKSMKSSSSQQASANANVGQSYGKSFGSSSATEGFTNASVGQVEAVKTLGRGPSRQDIGDANVGQLNPSQNMGTSPSKQVVGNENVRQADSLKSSSSKKSTASVKEGGGITEQSRVGEMEGIVTSEERVRSLLQEGLVEQFLNNVEGAFAKLVSIVQEKIECCMAEGDEISASWLSLWFIRFSHALADY